MSWKTTHPDQEKEQFILEHSGGDYGVSELAHRFGISRKTAYKWLARYALEGVAGLHERSRAPHEHPNELSAAIVERILEFKARWPHFGAPKLRYKLQEELGGRCPAESTISRVLQAHGLTRARGRRRWRGEGQPASSYHESNAVWCADFKGWCQTQDGARCTPLTISDGFSRFLLRCQGLGEGTGGALVQPIFEVTMREYGVPDALRTDNGTPFASTGVGGLTELSIWFVRLGIRLERGRPGCPQDNGRHERLHRTLHEATMEKPAANLRAQQRVFDAFRQEYNEERPHEALSGKTPADVYQASPRDFPGRLPKSPEYPSDWETRSVRAGGQMSWQGEDIVISKVLKDQVIGLEPIDDGHWRLWFGGHELGVFDERKGHLRPPPKKPKQPHKTNPPPDARAQ
jgi:transposase InsO family protein